MLDFILNIRQILPAYYLLVTIGLSFLCIFTLYGPKMWKIIPAITTYGKSFEETLDTSGFVRRISVPKSWFRHFYIVGFINSSLWVAYSIWPFEDRPVFIHHILKMMTKENANDLIPHTSGHLCLILILFHVMRRFYETYFVCVYSNSRMNILHYLLGILHYTFLPITIVCETYGVATNSHEIFPSVYNIRISQWFGIVCFVFCNFKQSQIANQVAETRLNRQGNVRDYRYTICRGGLFEYVSCPHFFYEILIYLSILLIIPYSYVFKFVLLFVVMNQMFAAEITHRWYHKKFGSKYPKNRKALIPFVF